VPVKVVRKRLPVDGTAALTVPPAALTLTAPVGATATLAPALTVAGVIVIVPPELGAAFTSERSWVLLETETAGPEPRRLFTTVVALLETFAATEPTVESAATGPPSRLAPKSPT
jgi:hypothetical protein